MATLMAAFTLLTPAPQAFAAGSVAGLAHCASGPNCHYGPVHAAYPNYASVCSEQNCNFVSAANLIQVTRGLTVSVSALRAAYTLAGQSYGGGLSLAALWKYWANSGIDGVYLASERSLHRDRADLENEVLGFGGLVVLAQLPNGAHLGPTKYGAGTAIMIVDGFTPKGPLVVFQGRTLELTWVQWRAYARSAWGVTTSLVAPTPPPSTPPAATLSVSPSSVSSSGATITLTFTSTNATVCTLSSTPSLWA